MPTTCRGACRARNSSTTSPDWPSQPHRPPAGLNQRVLRAVIADQEQLRTAAAHQRTKGVITLTALRAFLVIMAVTIATFSAGVWAASLLGN